MLSIQVSSKSAECSLLPCRIKHTGPTKATKKHWIVTEGEDNTKTASFRGRRLAGKSISVPGGYQGHVLEATGEKLPSEHQNSSQRNNQEMPEEKEDANIFKGLSTFDEITIWGHDAIPDESNDSVIRGIDEWIGFANKVHGFMIDDAAEKATQ